MSKKNFLLSASGLKNIVFKSNIESDVSIIKSNDQIEQNEDDFFFYIGETGIKMNRILAEFISPRVSSMHHSDPTINQLHINLKTTINLSTLDKFQSICKGESIEVESKEARELRYLSIYLWNDEISTTIDDLFPEEKCENSIDEILEFLTSIESDNNRNPQNQEEMIKNVSSQFYSIDPEKLYKLPYSILYSILINDELKLSDEDSLFEFIENLLSKKKETDREIDEMAFYELIDMRGLSEDKIRTFLDLIEPTRITGELWQKIKNLLFERIIQDDGRMKNEHRYVRTDHHKYTQVEYDANENHRFKGIISQLGNGSPTDVIEKGIINITSSETVSSSDSRFQPKNVVNFNDMNGCFHSSDRSNSFLVYDFKERKVKPSHYSIRSNNWSGQGNCHPKTWNIEGSNDNNNWTLLDKRTNDRSLDGSGFSNTFEIEESKTTNEYFQYLRITQTDVNTGNNNWLIFSALEYFGTIQEP